MHETRRARGGGGPGGSARRRLLGMNVALYTKECAESHFHTVRARPGGWRQVAIGLVWRRVATGPGRRGNGIGVVGPGGRQELIRASGADAAGDVLAEGPGAGPDHVWVEARGQGGQRGVQVEG